MSKPRIHILALGGTIATQPDASGVMQMGAGADDLVKAVPSLATLADIEAETVAAAQLHAEAGIAQLDVEADRRAAWNARCFSSHSSTAASEGSSAAILQRDSR